MLRPRSAPVARAGTGPRTPPRPAPALGALLLFSLSGALACADEAATGAARPFVAAISGDPGHLNPAITTNGGVHTAASLLYNGLVGLSEDLSPEPELAERWDVEDGGRTYRFHLRPDARWHDGVPLTAADVAYTFEEVLLRFHARTRASLEPVLEAVETPDAATVVFRLRRPYAPLLQQLNVVEAPILPRHLFAGTDPQRNPANTAPVGTGPFRFVAYLPDREIRYAANPDYFGGAPAIEQLVLRVIPDGSVQVMALEAGEVDWLFGVPGAERDRLHRDPRFRLVQTSINPGGSNCVMSVGFNLDRALLRDARARRAVAHAVDREQVLERVLFGEGRVATAPISSAIAFAHARDVELPPHHPAAARRLLEEAGWREGPDGVRVARGVPGVADGTRFAIGFKAMPTQVGYGDLLRAQLRAIGVELRVEALEPAVFAHAVFTQRDFDTAVVSYCNGTDPEIGVRRMFVSASIGPVPFSNAAGYANPVVDSLFDRAGGTLDPSERGALYREIQRIVVDDLPYLWLVETVATRAYRARCQGFGNPAHFAATARCGP